MKFRSVEINMSYVVLLSVFCVLAACNTSGKNEQYYGYTLIHSGKYEKAYQYCQQDTKSLSFNKENCLGIIYFLGLGKAVDYYSAHTWFSLAAENGNAFAQRNLSIMYTNGLGVMRNLELAYMWNYLSVLNGNPSAKNAMLHYTGMLGTNKMLEIEKNAKKIYKKNQVDLSIPTA